MSTIKVSNLQNASAASPAIVLDANSRATLNGLSYPTEGSLSGRNRVINGGMMVSQRNGTSSVNVSSDSYTLDRWLNRVSGGGVITNQQTTSVVPTGNAYALALTVQTADSSIAAGDVYQLGQRIEGFNTADLSWGTASASSVTLSFWVRSSVTGTFGIGLQSAANTRSYVATYTINAANTWEYKTITIAGDTAGSQNTGNGIGIDLVFDLGSGTSSNATAGSWGAGGSFWRTSGCVNWIANAGATFYITGVQLEAGSVATPFERRSLTQEQLLCSRYYHTNVEIGTLPNKGGGTYFDGVIATVVNSGTSQATMYRFPVPMRVAPTITLWTPNNGTQGQAWSEITQANVSYSINAGSKQFYSGTNPAGSGISGNAYYFHYAANAEL